MLVQRNEELDDRVVERIVLKATRLLDEVEEADEAVFVDTEEEREGQRRGRKAFMGIRYLMEDVRLKHETFQGWVTEMVDAGLTGLS